MEFKKKCGVCGKEFISTGPKGKYCSDLCRRKGKRENRKRWEKETGFLDKQRDRMRERRSQIREAEHSEWLQSTMMEREQRICQDSLRDEEYQAELIRKAEAGDPFSRMELIGESTPEYWRAFADYEIQQAAELGHACRTMVNESLVTDPDFPETLSRSIEEEGIIFITRDIQKEE